MLLAKGGFKALPVRSANVGATFGDGGEAGKPGSRRSAKGHFEKVYDVLTRIVVSVEAVVTLLNERLRIEIVRVGDVLDAVEGPPDRRGKFATLARDVGGLNVLEGGLGRFVKRAAQGLEGVLEIGARNGIRAD